MKLQNLIHILIGIVCIGFLPRAKAINPAPDGGYPGGNTAEGQNALFSLTTGGYNTAVGYLSLRSDTTGSFNTAVGAGALFSNTADQNTALGAAAGLSLTTGSSNICIGSGVIGTASDNNTIRIGDNLPNQGSNCYIGGITNSSTGVHKTLSSVFLLVPVAEPSDTDRVR